MMVGTTSLSISNVKFSILDTGTSMIALPSPIYNQVATSIQVIYDIDLMLADASFTRVEFNQLDRTMQHRKWNANYYILH
jgi:hypothetical protein